ncbi:DNA polymerase III subunit gamma/tau [Gemmatimonas sp.]|uniref:DNA polymerase III subunit gamma/tau n=1 Tax=Gemmatimonas sp. TaxID=1962908 RepID=UPI003569AD24
MSLALARKYRPRNFATVAVQSHVANTLKGAIASGRVAHGYLLCGPRGTGKTTLARVLAMALNCEELADARRASGTASATAFSKAMAAAGEPCGRCTSCQRIWSGSASLDVVEIDAASNGGVADARELRERAMYAPSGDDRYKVYIIDEAHMLSRDAWNALLKVLEEPPPRVVFVFATTEAQKVLPTVISRLQRFDLKRIGPAEIRERLASVLTEEGIHFEPDALGMIAGAADGGLRDALSLTDQVLSLGETAEVTSERVRTALGLVPEEEYLSLLDIIAQRRAVDVFGAVQRQADGGVDLILLLAGIGRMLRAQLTIALGGVPPELSERMRVALNERKGQLSAGDLLRMLHALLEIEPMYRRSGQPQLLLETLLVRFALLDRTVELEEVIKGFGAGGQDDPPPRRVAHEPRVASAHAIPPSPPPAVAYAVAPAPSVMAPPRSATQQVAEAAAAAQLAEQGPASRAAAAAPRVGPPPSVEQLKARWGSVSDAIKSAGRGMLAQAVARLVPASVSAHGSVALSYDPADDTFARAADGARPDILAALQVCFDGVTGVTVVSSVNAGTQAQSRAPRDTTKRLTAHDVQQQRTEQLSSKDPLLEAAVRALDLELLD